MSITLTQSRVIVISFFFLNILKNKNNLSKKKIVNENIYLYKENKKIYITHETPYEYRYYM